MTDSKAVTLVELLEKLRGRHDTLYLANYSAAKKHLEGMARSEFEEALPDIYEKELWGVLISVGLTGELFFIASNYAREREGL